MWVAFGLIGLSMASAASACSIVEPRPFQMRIQSKPAEIGNRCSFWNVGIHDEYAAESAEDLGDGRVVQSMDNGTGALVVDCQTSEAIAVYGRATQAGETSCGPDFVLDQVLKPVGRMTLTEGASLTELAAVARSRGLRADEELGFFMTDEWGERLWRKERVDLLCGCKLFYPNSPGAEK